MFINKNLFKKTNSIPVFNSKAIKKKIRRLVHNDLSVIEYSAIGLHAFSCPFCLENNEDTHSLVFDAQVSNFNCLRCHMSGKYEDLAKALEQGEPISS